MLGQKSKKITYTRKLFAKHSFYEEKAVFYGVKQY